MRQTSRRETQTCTLVVSAYWTKVQDSHVRPLTLGSSRRQMGHSCPQLTAPAAWVKVVYSNSRSLNLEIRNKTTGFKHQPNSVIGCQTPLPKKERYYSCITCNISFLFFGGGGGTKNRKIQDSMLRASET